MNKFDIFQSLIKHQTILINFGVSKCGLFGSFLREEATEKRENLVKNLFN